MRKIFNVFSLIRIHNCLLAGAAVWIGGYLCHRELGNPLLLRTALALALVCGAGNAFNDYCDVEIDKINHPRRPISRGNATRTEAMALFAVLNLLAIIFAAASGISILAVSSIYISALLLYNLKLKQIPLVGNLIVALLGGGTFMIGGMVICPDSIWQIPGPIIPAVFAFLFHLGREILKDIADQRGDKAIGYRILIDSLSLKSILGIITVIYVILIGLTLVPVFAGWFRYQFSIIVIALVDLPLIILLWDIWRSQSIERYNLIATYLKLLMIPGILAFILG